MSPDFLRQNAKKYNFLEKLIWKKTQENFIASNNNRIIRAWYLRGSRRAHIAPEEDWNFPSKDI